LQLSWLAAGKAKADFGNPRQIKNLQATGLILATCLAIHELMYMSRPAMPEEAFLRDLWEASPTPIPHSK
jgi:hypothetical protein